MNKDNLLSAARRAAKLDSYDDAEYFCKEYLSSVPSDREGLRFLAFIFSLKKEYAESMRVLSEIIFLTESAPEPDDYFNRGRWALECGLMLEAEKDFCKAVDLCQSYEDSYYLDSARLFRALVFERLGMKSEQMNELSLINDECQIFALGKLYSKTSFN